MRPWIGGDGGTGFRHWGFVSRVCGSLMGKGYYLLLYRIAGIFFRGEFLVDHMF